MLQQKIYYRIGTVYVQLVIAECFVAYLSSDNRTITTKQTIPLYSYTFYISSLISI